MTSAQQSALTPLQGIANGSTQITTGAGYQGLLSGQQPNAVSSYLTDTAAGKNLGGTPEFQAMLDDQARRTAHDVGSQASMAGRYGSGAMGDAAGRAIAQQRNAAVAQNYAQERSNQINAANLLSGEQQQGIANRMGALQGLTGVQGANISNQAGAAQNLFNAGDTANQRAMGLAALAPTLDSAQYMPFQQLLNVGQSYENQTQTELTDAANRWQQQQQQPFAQLQAYADMVNGVSKGYGTNTSISPTKKASALQSGVGGAAGGAALGSMIFPGVGTALGALGGGLLGAFS